MLTPPLSQHFVGVAGLARPRPDQRLLYVGVLAERQRVQHVVVHHSASAHEEVTILLLDEDLYQAFLHTIQRRAASEERKHDLSLRDRRDQPLYPVRLTQRPADCHDGEAVVLPHHPVVQVADVASLPYCS